MAFEARDRQRVALAALATLIAAPVIALASASDQTADGASGTSDTVVVDASGDGDSDGATAGPNVPPTTAPGNSPPVFMDGVAPNPGSQTIAIAVPPPPTGELMTVDATFSSRVSTPRQCLVDGSIQSNRIIEITHINNGRTATCTTALGAFNQPEPLVLHPELFSTLADVTDAPILVEVEL